MSMIKMPMRESVHILNEIDGLSKDQVTVEGDVYSSGTVLGLLDNGNYTQLDLTSGATQGHEAVAILYGHIDATIPVKTLVHTRLTAVYDQYLTWPTGITSAQKEAAVTSLATKNIILR